MPYADLTIVFPESEALLAKQDLTECLNRLPFLINLTPREKKNNLQLGSKSAAFIYRSLDHYRNHPEIRVPYLDIAAWENDYAVQTRLESLLRQIRSLEEAVNDTIIALSQENMTAALTCYKSAKNAAKQNVPGTDHIIADLQPMLPGVHQKRKKKEGEGKSEVKK
ncbi:MAG: hypothetical protein IPM47_07055 [Sphingobacteriales bacterium]|nr:MAG: hypothetical protein IPM47_07055 [Sphingobacteriales bacterium]